MRYRKIGRTGESASMLGFGCMRFPTIEGKAHKIDEKKAAAMVRYAVSHGVDYFDTAYPYHKSNRSPKGKSETFLGRALKEYPREDIKIATKLPSWLVKSRRDMDVYLDDQLLRLRTDHLDFYLLHGLNKESWANLTKHDVSDFLDGALSDGRISFAGFSFHDDFPLFKTIVDAYDWSFCQIQYNYMDEENQAGTKGLRYAAKKGLGVVVMEPLLGGFLGNKLPRDTRALLRNARPRRTPAELALRFLWDKPEISVVLSGMTTMPQLRENIRVADGAEAKCLTKGERKLVERVKTSLKSKSMVRCTACRYCMPCPSGVDIPACFEQLNHGAMYDDMAYAKRAYVWSVEPDSMASKCTECGRCEELCPQGVDIRRSLKEVARQLEA
jgi:predicted aldo/keto reductase-like oxidoreductase